MKKIFLLSILWLFLSFSGFTQIKKYVVEVEMLNKYEFVEDQIINLVQTGFINVHSDTSISLIPVKAGFFSLNSNKNSGQAPMVIPFSEIKEVRFKLPKDQKNKRWMTGGVIGGALTGLVAGIIGYRSGLAEGDDPDKYHQSFFLSHWEKGQTAKSKGIEKAGRYSISGAVFGGITGAVIGYVTSISAKVVIPMNGKKKNYKKLLDELK